MPAHGDNGLNFNPNRPPQRPPAPPPAPAHPAFVPQRASTGGSDAATSGPSYGAARANAYKASPAYKQVVAQVFRAQPPAQKAAVIRGVTRQPNSPEFQAVRNQWDHLSLPERSQIQSLIPHDLPKFISPSPGINLGNVLGTGLKDIYSQMAKPLDFRANATGIEPPLPAHAASLLGSAAKGADKGLAGLANVLSSAQATGPEGKISAEGIGGAAGALPKIALHAPIDVARATLQDPSVLPKTAKGFADTVVGSVAGALQLPINVVQQGPGKALSSFGHQIASDYSRRYGPLAAGNDQAFINRIKKEGAAPELFDAAAAAGGLDATLGRGVADISKTTAALSGKENFLTRPRKDLLLSGSKTRPQQLANTAGRITAQRLEDKLRAARTARHPGELTPNASQVAPIFQAHAMRVVHSGIAQQWRRVMQETLKTEVRGNPRGTALAAIGRLNQWQKQAIYHAVHGVRVDTPANFKADLMQRRDAIVAERTANPNSFGNRIPAQHADQVDELKLIDRLTAHADQIAGPRMVAFQKGEATRAQRLEAATALHPATAEARRLRPLGDKLGIEHPDTAAQRMFGVPEASWEKRTNLGRESLDAQSKKGLREYQLNRAQYLAKYVGKVRAGMKGLPEPGYFKHFERPIAGKRGSFSAFTSGSGSRAMAADKTSGWMLHRAGVADTSPDAYLQGLAQSVKRPLNWRLTDQQFRAAALPTPAASEIKAALGRRTLEKPHASQTPEQIRQPANKGTTAAELTGNDLRRVLEHRGVNMDNVMFYNPGRLAEQTLSDHGLLPKGHTIAETHDPADHELHALLDPKNVDSPIVQRGNVMANDHFMTTPGWKAIPKTAYDEIHGGLKASSLGGRIVGKVQGTSAGLILGQNPHFLIMNTLAHLFPAVAGTKGRILPDLLKTPVWWHGLSDAEKNRVRMVEGGRGGHYNMTARLGSTAPNQIAAMGRKLGENGLVQKAQALNPLHAILKAEDLQSNFFRHAVMYHEIKRAAYQDMAHEFGHAVSVWQQVKHVFDLGPQERSRAIMQNMTKMEDLGRTTVNILGDYGRFTARERQFLNNRAIMFYSFLRHVTRTLLYVLPARHPLAYGMMGELGNLHVEEVKKLLGGQDLPWAYGRLFFDGSKLKSIDLASTSPVSSPLVDIMSGGVKQLPRLLSPALAPLLDIAYGQTPVGAKVKQNAWTYLNDLFSLSYPYRSASAIRFGLKPQQSDSVPLLHERGQTYKTASAQQYQAAKTQARGPLKDYLLGSLLGVYPKPDDSRVIAQHMAAKKKGGGSSATVIPGGGSLSDVVIPGAGGTNGVVIP